jgi:hypothetical protein
MELLFAGFTPLSFLKYLRHGLSSMFSSFFLFLVMLFKACIYPFFFLHSPVSFRDIWKGVNPGTMHGALFGGIDG